MSKMRMKLLMEDAGNLEKCDDHVDVEACVNADGTD